MTLCDLSNYCLYTKTQVMLKLRERARGHFVMLIKFHVHLIRVNPEHTSSTLLKPNTANVDK